MAISARLKAFLDAAKIRYTSATHPVAYTAQEIAAAQHVSGRQVAKSVLVKTKLGPVLAVLPAIYLIDFKKLKALLHAKTVTIAKEADIKATFPDVEVGAMSPFGHLYGVPVVVDRSLEEAERIVFNAGTHTQTIAMRVGDFVGAVKPKLGHFAQITARPKPKTRKKNRRPRNRRAPHGRPRSLLRVPVNDRQQPAAKTSWRLMTAPPGVSWRSPTRHGDGRQTPAR